MLLSAKISAYFIVELELQFGAICERNRTFCADTFSFRLTNKHEKIKTKNMLLKLFPIEMFIIHLPEHAKNFDKPVSTISPSGRKSRETNKLNRD